MLASVFRLLSFLPLAWLHAAGRILGVAVYLLPGRYRTRLRANAAQAGYPQARFARRAAAEAGAAMLELPWVWFRTDAALARVHSPDDHLIEAARAAGKSIVFLTPHLGGFEMSARHAARFAPITVLYRPPRQAALARLIEAARAASRVQIAPANVAGVRQLLRTLRAGGQIGILPDQVPGEGEGAWADFFGRPAYTMTLPARLADNPAVTVIAAACERLPRGRGWRLHLAELAPPPAASGPAAAAWINQAMQDMIRRCPQQYLWSYNRYKNP